MKKSLLFLMVLVYSSVGFSQQNIINQEPTKKYAYCELVEEEWLLSNDYIRIEFGKSKDFYEKDTLYLYENNKEIVFDCFVDGMNYMSNLGWEFVQAYTKNYDERGSVIHWILRKEIKE